FNGADVELPGGPLDLVFTVGINEYRGERALQLGYVAHRPAEIETIDVESAVPLHRQIHDWRRQRIDLSQLPAPDQAVWYAEGMQLDEAIAYAPRTGLADSTKGGTLVLWSSPPSPQLLHWLIETNAPSVIHICAQTTSDDAPATVLQDVARMGKYALARDGLLAIDRMAARLGTTEAVVRHSLLWLQNRGRIQIEAFLAGNTLRIAAGDGLDQRENADILKAELEEQLAEVRAYRNFFLRAQISELGLTATK
ncbi:MAG: hypothetical protein M3Q45_12230, partial [Chloroflexota bacterium]|nr:hypothetical protein [Chloroflexota bacterium]